MSCEEKISLVQDPDRGVQTGYFVSSCFAGTYGRCSIFDIVKGQLPCQLRFKFGELRIRDCC
jgi:hypothetical protein